MQDDHPCDEPEVFEFAEHMLSGVNRGNVWYKYGLTALQVAIITGNLLIIDELLKSNGGSSVSRRQDEMTELHITALTGNADTMLKVLDMLDAFGWNYSVNAVDIKGRTPLHFAMRIGNTRVVQMLLNRGADWNARDLMGGSSLDIAMFLNDPDMMETLQAYPSSPIRRGARTRLAAPDTKPLEWFEKWIYGIPGQKPLGTKNKPPIEFSIFGGVPPGPRIGHHDSFTRVRNANAQFNM